MHNGTIADFVTISRELCNLMDDDSYANISGSTDSEHFAALYITYLTEGKGKASWERQYPIMKMREALRKAIGSVVELQRKKLGDKAQANSLNVAATDGTKLVAFRYRNHAVEQPPSLYYSTTAGITLNRKYPDHPDGKKNPHARKEAKDHGSHVIVASEPTTYREKEWTLIEKNHCVLVEQDGSVTMDRVQYPGDWDAPAGTSGF